MNQLLFNRMLTGVISTSLILAPGFADAAQFNNNWTPKPLVDTNPVAKPVAVPVQPPAIRPDAEALLKPAEPFIASVEKQLYIQPTGGITLVQRLNHLQTVLFGTTKYQDAGQLLNKLAEVFPQEAAQARANLTAQLHPKQPQQQSHSGIYIPPQAKVESERSARKSRLVEAYPSVQNNRPVAMPYTEAPSPSMSTAPKKKRFWNRDDEWDDAFKNDSFFNDHMENTSPQSNTGSTLGGLGTGLASLAMLAGSLAGSYYLNKKLGNSNNSLSDPYYSNNGLLGYSPYYGGYGYGGLPYGYSNYGYPRPYGSLTPGIIAPGMPFGSNYFPRGYTTTRTYPLY
jgi:hypothetical protein